MTVVTIMASTTVGSIHSLLRNSKGILPDSNIRPFSRCNPFAFLALLHNGLFNSLKTIPIFTLGIFGILAFSKSAKMQGVHWGCNYWNPLARNHCISCIICIFQIPKVRKMQKVQSLYADFFFSSPLSLVVRYSLIYTPPYWTKPKSIDGDRRKKEEPSDVGRRVPKIPKCQKCHGVKTTASHSR